MAEDADYIPSCTFNSVLSGGSILDAAQAAVFVLPNPILGLFGFPCVIVVGAAVVAGARFARRFSTLFLAGTTRALMLIHLLAYQSRWRLNVLCRWCLVVWAVTIPISWFTLLHVLTPEDATEATNGGDRFMLVLSKYR